MCTYIASLLDLGEFSRQLFIPDRKKRLLLVSVQAVRVNRKKTCIKTDLCFSTDKSWLRSASWRWVAWTFFRNSTTLDF